MLTTEIVPSLQEVMGARARFPKPTDVYELLATFGTNILVTEGEEWKRQRKIAAPAFSEVCPVLCQGHPSGDDRHLMHLCPPQRNNKLVWDESLRVVNDMFENLWGDKDAVELDHVLDITIPVSLLAPPPPAHTRTSITPRRLRSWSSVRRALDGACRGRRTVPCTWDTRLPSKTHCARCRTDSFSVFSSHSGFSASVLRACALMPVHTTNSASVLQWYLYTLDS